ncbi:MAG TPA: HAD family hydrolase, partial [Anaerolineae bacterium]|nr:HAD family hydrolase [Anaerolineae bacterium]
MLESVSSDDFSHRLGRRGKTRAGCHPTLAYSEGLLARPPVKLGVRDNWPRKSMARMNFVKDFGDVEAVLFDFDGTLVHLNIDFGRMRAELEALLPQYGLSMEGRSNLYILELIEDAVRELRADDEEKAQAFQQEAKAAIVAIELEAADKARVYPEVPELLRGL